MHQEENFDIAIIGMAGRFPGASNIDGFWQNLKEGKESITFFSDEALLDAGLSESLISHPNYVKAAPTIDHPGAFDEGFFGYAAREARMMDPQHRLFLEEAWHALEHAGYHAENLDGQVGVFAGSAMNTYLLFSGLLPRFVDEYLPTLIGSDKDFLSTRVSYKLNLKGPSISIQTACSTSLVAVHMACQSLLNGETDMALAGGVSVRVPHIAGHMYAAGSVFSPDGHCRPFDASAQGTIFGSGVGVVVLKRLNDALQDRDMIYAVIKGSAVNNDGSSKADYTAPSIQSQADVISEALSVADVDAASISYIEAHGTGTYLGDPIEVMALTRAFRAFTEKKGFCKIGSVKANIGHLDAAAGMAGLIKTTLALQHGEIPATINFEKPNPEIDFDNSPFLVNNVLSPWSAEHGPRRAGVTALGIGGTNAHVVLEEAPAQDQPKSEKGRQLLVFSARTPEALAQLTTDLGNHLSNHKAARLLDAAHTLQVGRKMLEHRRFCVVEDHADAAGALLSLDEERVVTVSDNAHRQSVVFMFSGQGAQYVQMARELYEKETVFRDWVDQQANFLTDILSIDLRTILFASEGDAAATEKLNQTCFAQPALFMVEYALAMQWKAWGIQPAGLIGHSIGEYAAACIAGVFSWEDALKLVAERGRLMQQMPTGRMLGVKLSDQELKPFLEKEKEVELAAVNSAALCVVSGTNTAIDLLEQKLAGEGVSYQPLHTSHAFHSSMMEPVLDEFAAAVSAVKLQPPALQVVSNVTGTWLTDAEATNPTYWAHQLRQPVLFKQGITELLKTPGRVFLEVGPGNTLGTFVRRHAEFTADHSVLTSIRHPNENVSDQQRLLETAGHLWAHGLDIDWQAVHGEHQPGRVALPGYPFARTHHWFVSKSKKESQHAEGNRHMAFNGTFSSEVGTAEAARRAKPADWFYQPSWKRSRRLDGAVAVLHDKQPFLVFAGEASLVGSFCNWANEKGHPVVTVSPGKKFAAKGKTHFVIDPTAAEDYLQLLEQLHGENLFPRYIANFWTIEKDKPLQQLDEADLHNIKTRAFYSQFYLAKTLWQGPWKKQQVKVGIITSQLFDVTGEEHLSPAKALLLGPAGVLPKELPTYDSFVVDVPSAMAQDDAALAGSIGAEFGANGGSGNIAYRGKHRWMQCFELVQLPSSSNPAPVIRKSGVYIITGGLGGVGMAIAASLANTPDVKLILLGRSPMPERKAWDAWMADHDMQDGTSKKIESIRALEHLGAQVATYAVDVADSNAVQKLIDAVIQRFGKINGIVHAAGVIEDMMAPLKEASSVERVLAAKVAGTLNLGRALHSVKPDFFLLCSSINAHVAPAGQIDYVAANQFMDHFAVQYSANTGIPVQSVNWPGWTEVGMLAAHQAKATGQVDWLAEALSRGVNTAEGIQALHLVLKSGLRNTIVSPVPFPYPQKAPKRVEQPAQVQTATVSNDSIESQLQAIWAEVLEIDQVGVNDNFFNLGGNSLMAITLFAEIERQMGKVEHPLSALLEAPTIRRFAKLLRGTGEEERKTSLVMIQEGKSPEGATSPKAPLFCIHGAGGNVLLYQQLARQLGESQTVYGCQASGLDGVQPILSDIKSMARNYVDEVLRIAPEGPYLLMGYCMGGTIAWEMGQQLRERGITDVTLFMLETYNWKNLEIDSIPHSLRYYAEKVYFHAKNFYVLDQKGRQKFWKEKTTVLRRRSQKWKGSLLARVGIHHSNGESKSGFSEDLLARIWKTNDDAALAYTPEPYAGRVVHIRPQSEYQRHKGADMGWDSLAKNLETITLPVYPAGMLVQPFVSTLAKHIKQIIDTTEDNTITS